MIVVLLKVTPQRGHFEAGGVGVVVVPRDAPQLRHDHV
jgi:hypothetical protein